jgi:hypothetical protein
MHNPLDSREPSFIGLSIALRRAKAEPAKTKHYALLNNATKRYAPTSCAQNQSPSIFHHAVPVSGSSPDRPLSILIRSALVDQQGASIRPRARAITGEPPLELLVGLGVLRPTQRKPSGERHGKDVCVRNGGDLATLHHRPCRRQRLHQGGLGRRRCRSRCGSPRCLRCRSRLRHRPSRGQQAECSTVDDWQRAAIRA